MKISSREEVVVELFRKLDIEQRNEIITRLRAAVDGNRAIERVTRKPFKVVPNERIEAKFGKAPPRLKKPSTQVSLTKPSPRRPDRNQDDSTPET